MSSEREIVKRLWETKEYEDERDLDEKTYTVGDKQYWRRGGKYYCWTSSNGKVECSEEEYMKAISNGDHPVKNTEPSNDKSKSTPTIKPGDRISYNHANNPDDRDEDILVVDVSNDKVTIQDPYGAYGETFELDIEDLLDLEIVSSEPEPKKEEKPKQSKPQDVESILKGLATDDYQGRKGDYPRSGVPDTIDVSKNDISFSFKNTSTSKASDWVKSYLRKNGIEVNKKIEAYQSGDYEDDWVDVYVPIKNLSIRR